VVAYLPPRQRAVLILRDVLRFRTTEVARLLDTTAIAVKGMLQRARATLAVHHRPTIDPGDLDADQHARLARYVDAFERYDMDALVALLHDDATGLPPESWRVSDR
jgi:RNA polymerase sigma-70 factor (ECF subfamily)